MSKDQGVVCQLVPIQENGVPEFPVKLPDGQPVMLGRSPLTGIKDKRLSRQQVEVTADGAKKTLKCKQLGSNPCLVSNEILAKGEIVDLPDGATLNLLLGRFKYRVEFLQSTSQSGGKSIPMSSAEKNTSGTNSISKSTLDSKNTAKPVANVKAQKRPMTDDSVSADEKQAAKRSKTEETPSIDDSNIDEKLAALRKQAEKYEKKTVMQKSAKTLGAEKEEDKQKGPEKLKQGEASVGPKWEEHGSLVVYTSNGVRSSNWVAGFDMDGTIITTQSGKVFPTSISDWKILYPDIIGKLKKLVADGYKVVFLTNQLGVGRGKVSLGDMKQKVSNIVKRLGVPVQVLMATGAGIYRKPATGMWTYLQSNANDGISVDTVTSFYVGGKLQ